MFLFCTFAIEYPRKVQQIQDSFNLSIFDKFRIVTVDMGNHMKLLP